MDLLVPYYAQFDRTLALCRTYLMKRHLDPRVLGGPSWLSYLVLHEVILYPRLN
jgi:hypothetical protein